MHWDTENTLKSNLWLTSKDFFLVQKLTKFLKITFLILSLVMTSRTLILSKKYLYLWLKAHSRKKSKSFLNEHNLEWIFSHKTFWLDSLQMMFFVISLIGLIYFLYRCKKVLFSYKFIIFFTCKITQSATLTAKFVYFYQAKKKK